MPASIWEAYVDDIALSFRKQKDLAEQAIEQLDDAELFHKPGEHSNSVATIVKHLAGNLKSRWTDFLTSDGDKPWRDRDDEFTIGPQDSPTTNDVTNRSELKMPQLRICRVRFWLMNNQPVLLPIGAKNAPMPRIAKIGATPRHFSPSTVTINCSWVATAKTTHG